MQVPKFDTALTLARSDIQRFGHEVLILVSGYTQAEMKRQAPVAFGALRDSITKKLTYGQAHSVAQIAARPEYGYAEAMEEGFRPMGVMPPWQVGSRLYLWTWLKSNLHLTEPKKIERQAFLIARSIAERPSWRFPVVGKRGKTGGRFYAKKTVELIRQAIPGIVSNLIRIFR